MGLFDKAMKQGLGEALGKAAKQLDRAMNQAANQGNGCQQQMQQSISTARFCSRTVSSRRDSIRLWTTCIRCTTADAYTWI